MKKPYGTVINQDADGFLYSVGLNPFELTTHETLRAFPHQFEGTTVTDYFICVCNATASYPSKVLTSVLDKYYQKEENGYPVDYSEHPIIKAAHHIYETLGADYIQIWHEEFRKIGIRPWISFRMNDAHDHKAKTSFLLTDQFHAHPECYRVSHHDPDKLLHRDRIWNYGMEYVRDLYLRFLAEALERYDTDGVEFDFMRDPWCFDIGGEYEGIDIMTDFVRSLKACVDSFAAKRGHPIQIAFRCPATPQMSMDFGFDVATYAREGLVNVVAPCGRWDTNDNDMPVRLWCSMLNPYGVAVWAGIECNMEPYPGAELKRHTLESYAGIAAASMYQGSEKTYLYNCFRYITPMMKPAAEQDGSDPYWNRVALVGDYGKMMNHTRRVMVTYRDNQPLGYAPSNILPLNCTEKNRLPLELRFNVGEVPRDAQVYVRFSVSDPDMKPEDWKIWLSSKPCEPVDFGPLEQDENYTKYPILTFRCTEPIKNGIAIGELQMENPQKVTVDFAEIVIKN